MAGVTMSSSAVKLPLLPTCSAVPIGTQVLSGIGWIEWWERGLLFPTSAGEGGALMNHQSGEMGWTPQENGWPQIVG